MKKYAFRFAIVSCLFIVASCNQSADSKKIADNENDKKFDNNDGIEKDADFVVNAADGGMLEVQLGQLAQTNGMSNDIKELGKHMTEQHTEANEELKKLAATKNITIGTILSDKAQGRYNDLAKKNGADFDKAYAEMMVKDHKDDLDEFQKESADGKDADIRSWAKGMLTVLQDHLHMAEIAKTAVKDEK